MKLTVRSILIGGVLLGSIGAGVYLYAADAQRALPQELVMTPDTPSATPTPELVLHDDPAGFTIEYPNDLSVDLHNDDKINYAHVEFTKDAMPGRVTVWVTDIPRDVTDTKSWATTIATSSSTITFDTMLGEKPAKKLLISDGQKRQVVGLVFDGVVWYIETELDPSGYWQSVTETLVDHFVFKPLPTQAPSSGGYDTSVSVDEDEVLE